MRKLVNFLLEYGLLIIITIPAFVSLLNPQYFSHHDSQQAARLFVLTEAIKQGDIYPRWVDLFGFNYGYPLFNFYPPLIYYVGALFYSLGFSVLWSVKMIVISGYVLAAAGMYLLVKKLVGRRPPAYLAAVLYTYFTYHAINAYVRGALAEFFSMTVLPFVFLSLESLRQTINVKNTFFFSITFGLLILTHPLIAFPSILFIGAYMLHSLVLLKEKGKYALHAAVGGVGGLSLSAFFWLPSMLERRFTLTDNILLTELASHEIHFVQPGQLWFSPWGYGGSGPGYRDGMTFQLGKIHIAVALFSLVATLLALYLWKTKRIKIKSYERFCDFGFYFVFMLGAIFMMIQASGFLWNLISFLQYLQFPWRFMTFVGIFMSVVGGYGIYYIAVVFNKKWITVALTVLFSAAAILTYQKYFKPETYLNVTDKELTSFEEIAWRVSRTSFEFIPKDVKTKKSELNTTIPDIEKQNVSRNIYQLSNGTANVSDVHSEYSNKRFNINVFDSSVDFRLNTYNFPGWTAYVDGKKTKIRDNNPFKLITIAVPKGNHTLQFRFEDTPVRAAANSISAAAALTIGGYLIISKLKKS